MTSNPTYAIEIQGLEQTYNTFHLNNFSLCVPYGEVAGLIGSNGAGKTTVLKSLFGAYKPTTGTVRVLNTDMRPNSREAASAKAHIGFVFDTTPFGNLQVKDVARIGSAQFQTFDASLFWAELKEANIDAKARANKLSRGMSMRLQLAFALAHRPSILVLDEATAGLDPMAKQDVCDKLRNFMETPGRAILFSSHDTPEVEELADTVTCLSSGTTLFQTTMDQLQENARLFTLPKAQATRLIGELTKTRIPAYSLQNELNTQVLVMDASKLKALPTPPSNPAQPAHLDVIMRLMMRGEKHA